MRRASEEDVKSVLAAAPIEHILMSAYDEFVETNAKIRAEAGLKELIIREAIGGCCDWCSKLAGIYEYGKHPKDVFRKHDNCTCMVTHKTEKGYTDVWSKKTFENHREARISKAKELEKEIAATRAFDRKRRIAKSLDMKCYDATEEWNFRRGNQAGTVRDASPRIAQQIAKESTPEGYSGKYKLQFKHNEQERRIAKLMRDKYGGDILLLPEVKTPTNCQMSDYLWNGKRYDLKTLKKPGKDTLYNAIHKKREQANDFIIDVSPSGMDEKEAITQAEKVFRRRGTHFVESILLVKDEEIIRIYERI